MLLVRDLAKSVTYVVDKLNDPSIGDDTLVGFLMTALMYLTVSTGIKFTITGTSYTDYTITDPVVNDDLKAIILLQTKQIANGNSNVTKAKVGSLQVDYDPKAWQRDQDYLEKMINYYASENNITTPSSYVVDSMNEFDIALNPYTWLGLLDNAIYNPNTNNI